MRIAVNTRLLLKDRLEGIGWFSFETLKRITQQHPEHQFFFLFDRPYDPEFIFSGNITPLVLPPQARHPVLFYAWFEYSVPRALRKIKADLFLSPDGYLSLSSPVKSIPVIHDLNFEHYPKDLPWLITRYYRHFFPKFAAKAARIATVSEFSKSDIHTLYGIDNNKIDVVYNGASDAYAPLDEERRVAVKNRHAQGQDYFLFVGSLHPRKNIANLLKAFDAFRSLHGRPVKLLIAGQKMWWTADIQSAYENMKAAQDVIFTGRLSQEELQEVMASALALTYPSSFEGFGIPILEAFRSDVPVITSDRASMPEVSGDAALLVDPFSVDSIKEAMLAIASDPALRESLAEKGRARKEHFSWDKTAQLLYAAMEKEL